MKARQTTVPEQWFVVDSRLAGNLCKIVRSLPRGSGMLFLHRHLPKRERERLLRTLRRCALGRSLVIVDEAAGQAARVHNAGELRRAALAQIPLLFLSPMFPTRSHPQWKPLPRMRAAALLRLANAPVIALGGMNEKTFSRVERLGFQGWAGIDAWIRT